MSVSECLDYKTLLLNIPMMVYTKSGMIIYGSHQLLDNAIKRQFYADYKRNHTCDTWAANEIAIARRCSQAIVLQVTG